MVAFWGAAVEDADAVAVTGQTVVYRAMVDVMTVVDWAGQLVTLAAHRVTTISVVW